MILILIILSLIVFVLFFNQIKEIDFFEKKDSNQALVYLDSGQYEKAEKIYLNLIKDEKPGYVGDLFYLGKVYYLQGRIEESKNTFKEVANKNVDNVDIKNSLIFLALIAEEEGDCDLAIEYINKYYQEVPLFSLKENSFLENIPLILSKCYLRKGEIDKSANIINDQLKNDMEERSFARLIVQLADNNLFLANYAQSLELFGNEKLEEEIKQKRKGFIAMNLLGQEKYDDIKDILSSSFYTLDKENLTYAYYSLGVAEIKSKNYKDAEEAFQNIYDQVIKSFDIDNFGDFYRFNLLRYYGLGILNVSQNNNIEAANYFKKIISISEEIPNYRMDDFKNKIDIYFLNLLANYELIKIGDSSEKGKLINGAQEIINQLTIEEREIINKKNIGNNIFIIDSIEKINKEFNEKN